MNRIELDDPTLTAVQLVTQADTQAALLIVYFNAEVGAGNALPVVKRLRDGLAQRGLDCPVLGLADGALRLEAVPEAMMNKCGWYRRPDDTTNVQV